MDADVRAEFAGALVLLGAFRAARVEVGEYTERIRQRVGAETEKEPPPPSALEEAAAAALEAVETDAVTVADYTAVIKPKEPVSTPHPASKRQCVRSINQAPS